MAPNKPVIPNNPDIGKPTGTGFGGSNLKPKPPTIPWWLIRLGGAAYVFWSIVDAGSTADGEIPKPDPNECEQKKRRDKCKDNGGSILYRGDGRNPFYTDKKTPKAIFDAGFISHGKNENFYLHVNNKPHDTAFISTSQSDFAGIQYASNFKRRNDGYLYEICDPGNKLGFNRRRDAKEVYDKIKEDTGEPSDLACQEEIAFKKQLPAKYIISATPVTIKGKVLHKEVIFNPNYDPQGK